MLTRLLATIESEGGRPVRLSELARQLGTDATVVEAMVGHATARGLLPGVALSGDVASRCGPDDCAGRARPACRRCPLGISETA